MIISNQFSLVVFGIFLPSRILRIIPVVYGTDGSVYYTISRASFIDDTLLITVSNFVSELQLLESGQLVIIIANDDELYLEDILLIDHINNEYYLYDVIVLNSDLYCQLFSAVSSESDLSDLLSAIHVYQIDGDSISLQTDQDLIEVIFTESSVDYDDTLSADTYSQIHSTLSLLSTITLLHVFEFVSIPSQLTDVAGSIYITYITDSCGYDVELTCYCAYSGAITDSLDIEDGAVANTYADTELSSDFTLSDALIIKITTLPVICEYVLSDTLSYHTISLLSDSFDLLDAIEPLLRAGLIDSLQLYELVSVQSASVLVTDVFDIYDILLCRYSVDCLLSDRLDLEDEAVIITSGASRFYGIMFNATNGAFTIIRDLPMIPVYNYYLKSDGIYRRSNSNRYEAEIVLNLSDVNNPHFKRIDKIKTNTIIKKVKLKSETSELELNPMSRIVSVPKGFRFKDCLLTITASGDVEFIDIYIIDERRAK